MNRKKTSPKPAQSDSNAKKRKRGGQPGNTNALKHGFYAQSFNQRELEIFSGLSLEDFQGEIDLTRVSNRRILEAMHANPDLSFDQILAGSRAISFGTALIASLSRARLQVSLAASQAHEMEKWLQDLLEEHADDELGQADALETPV